MNSEKQGYLGNLEDKSIQELQELLSRQEGILRKKKFVSSLPDKGRKILGFREQLVDLITRKQNLYSEEAMPQSLNSTTDQKIMHHKNPQIRLKSRFSEEDRVTKLMKSTTVPVEKNVVRDVVTMDTQQTEEVIEESRVLQASRDTKPSTMQNASSKTHGLSDFAKLRDKSGSRIHQSSMHLNNCNETGQQKLKTHEKVVDMLETAMERMEIDPAVPNLGSEELRNKILQNSAQINPHFKANSFLKIHHVQDLPDKYKWKSRTNHPIPEQETSGPHHIAIKEETAATPPDYKYNEARLITLEESMQIQQAQQKHQEELQAMAAAERLAKSLKIKMESYNPEGRDIVYRGQPESFNSDSDDEPEVEFYPDDVD